MMISRVARVNSSHPYLENDPSSSLVSHRLRISPWLRFSRSEGRGEAALPNRSAIKRRQARSEPQAQFPTPGKCTSHLLLGSVVVSASERQNYCGTASLNRGNSSFPLSAPTFQSEVSRSGMLRGLLAYGLFPLLNFGFGQQSRFSPKLVLVICIRSLILPRNKTSDPVFTPKWRLTIC